MFKKIIINLVILSVLMSINVIGIKVNASWNYEENDINLELVDNASTPNNHNGTLTNVDFQYVSSPTGAGYAGNYTAGDRHTLSSSTDLNGFSKMEANFLYSPYQIDSDENYIMGYDSNNFKVFQKSGRLRFGINLATDCNIDWWEYSAFMTAGNTYFLTITYNGTHCSILNNLTEIKTESASGSYGSDPMSDWTIGGRSGGSSADGIIDCFTFTINDVHTNSERQELYNDCFNVTQAPDTTAPIVSNLQNITTNQSVNITWNTDENANYTLRFSNGSIYEESTFKLSHVKFIGQLINFTSYWYNFTVCDILGNCDTTQNYEFTTLQNTWTLNNNKTYYWTEIINPQNTTNNDSIYVSFTTTGNVTYNEFYQDGILKKNNTDENNNFTLLTNGTQYNITIHSHYNKTIFNKTQLLITTVQHSWSLPSVCSKGDNNNYESFYDYSNFTKVYSVNISCGIAQLNLNGEVIKPSIDENTYSYWDFEDTLTANFTVGTDTPSASSNYKFITLGDEKAVRLSNASGLGTIDYNLDTLPYNLDNFTIELSFYYFNSSVSEGTFLQSLNYLELNTNRNSNGLTYYIKEQNEYLHSFYNMTPETEYVIKLVQQKEKGYYEQYLFINNILVYRGESGTINRNSIFNPFEINPTSSLDFAVKWISISNVSRLQNVNSTSSEDFDKMFYGMLESGVMELPDLNKYNLTLTLDISNNNTIQDDVLIQIHGCGDNNKHNCTKTIPYPIVIFEQDGTDDTSGNTFYDNAIDNFDNYNKKAILSYRTASPNTTIADYYLANNYRFGIEGDTNNDHTNYYIGMTGNGYTPLFYKYYQNAVTPDRVYNKTFQFRWQSSSESLYENYYTPNMMLIGSNQCQDDSNHISESCMRDNIDSAVSDNSLRLINFHGTASDDDWDNVLSYANNNSVKVWTDGNLESTLFFVPDINNAEIDYLQNYPYYFYRILIRGDIQIDNLSISFTEGENQSEPPPEKPYYWVEITNPLNWTNNESVYVNFTETGNGTNSLFYLDGVLKYNGSNKWFNYTNLNNNTQYNVTVWREYNSTIRNSTELFITTEQNSWTIGNQTGCCETNTWNCSIGGVVNGFDLGEQPIIIDTTSGSGTINITGNITSCPNIAPMMIVMGKNICKINYQDVNYCLA